MNLAKSPSTAAAEICAQPRTCVVKFPAIVLTDNLQTVTVLIKLHEGTKRMSDVPDFLPNTLNIADFGLHA